MKNNITKYTLTLGSALVLTALNAHAEIFIKEPIVKSFYGQPLSVEIPVQADAADWDSLWGTVELSNGLMMETQWKRPFAPGNIGSIEIKTGTPVYDPVVDLKIRVESMKNKTVMYYPILVDKYYVRSTIEPKQAFVSNESLPPTIETKDAMKMSTSIGKDKTQTPEPTKKPTKESNLNESNVLVRAGDTLFKIAKKHKPQSMSTYQAVMKIYNANKDVIGNNMNLIKVGMVLKLDF